MKNKSPLILIFFLIAGFVVGGMVAEATKNIPFLMWLSYGKSIGVDAGKPAYIDLALLKIAFGFEMNLNVSEVVFMVLSLFISHKFNK